MDSDLNNHHHQQQQQQQNMNSGLTRYRSAPSSYFSTLINSGVYEGEDTNPFLNPRVSSPETERILSRFMSNGGGDNSSSRQNLDQIWGNESQFMDSMKQEQLTFSSLSLQQQQMIYQNHARNNNSVVSSSSSAMVDPLMAMNPPTNLLPQSSSPANGGYVSSFHGGGWDESAMLSDGFLKEIGDSDRISSSENQNQGRIHTPTGLTHQLSLPTSSTELSTMEILLQFQDNVPLRSRAKRGCATHPRSIAERVRRTRISERMRRLQDLVPNMDKQTNTADMLDLAVDYIKELQKQSKTLSDHHAKCTCQHKREL